jgi:hypothetical protein
MRRPVSVKTFLSSFLFFSFSASFISSFSQLFPLSQAASVATLPSALFVERLSLGARWVYLTLRRLLNQAANAAAKTKGSIFEIVYRRSVPRLGHNQTIGAIAHRQCRLIWLILHQGVRYEERGPAVNKQSKQRRTSKMIRQLRNLGYRIEPPNPQQPSPAQPE